MNSHPERVSEIMGQTQDIALIGSRPWGDRLVSKLPALALAALLCLSPSVQAAQRPHPPGGMMSPEQAAISAPFVELGSMMSRDGESKNGFLLRVARVLDDFSTRTQQEACSAIMANATNTQWQVRLITNQSHVACARILFDEPGFSYTGATIHSHPATLEKQYNDFTVVLANAADERFAGMECGRKQAVEDTPFSLRDRENGEGYLVSRGKLRYVRDYNSTPVVIGKLDRRLPPDALIPPSSPSPSHVQGLNATTVSGAMQGGSDILGCQPKKKPSWR